MSKTARKSRVNEKNLSRKIKELSFGSLEIAAIAQEVIRRRMERALQREKELDEMMEALLQCAAVAEDKGAARTVLARFDAIKIEDISKALSVLKACSNMEISESDNSEGGNVKLKFEDMYG